MKVTALLPAVLIFPLTSQATSQSAPQGTQDVTISLPDGRAGQPYYEVLSGITTIATGKQTCPIKRPEDLAWLKFSCTGQAPIIEGAIPKESTRNEAGGRRTIKLDWIITDELKRQTVLHLTLRILGEKDRLAQEASNSPSPSTNVSGVADTASPPVGSLPAAPAPNIPAPVVAPALAPPATSGAGGGTPPKTVAQNKVDPPKGVGSEGTVNPEKVDLTQVVLAGEPHDGDKKVAGVATMTGASGIAGVAILRLQPGIAGPGGCIANKDLGNKADKTYEVLETSTRGKLLGEAASSGDFTIDLREELKAGDLIQAVQVLDESHKVDDTQVGRCTSNVHTVQSEFDFYRTNVTAVFGVVLSSSGTSATRSNFAAANQLLALNVDHSWVMPGRRCIISDVAKAGTIDLEQGYRICNDNQKPGFHQPWWQPGVSSYSDSRLTSIPVSTPSAENPAGTANTAATTTKTAGSSSVRSLATAQAADTATTSGTVASLLSGAQTFRQGIGIYLPWVPVHGPGFAPRGLMIGPIAKAGFDTITSTDAVPNVILPNNSPGTLAFQTAYKFYSYGLRIGEVGLSASPTKAPEIKSYLDISVGRFSNLQSFVCHTKDQKGNNASALTAASACATDYPDTFSKITNATDPTTFSSNIYLSRKQLYRLSIEGLVQVPLTGRAVPLYVGVNANIGQRSGQAERLDHGYATPDDIRIFFGTRLDINRLAAWIAKDR